MERLNEQARRRYIFRYLSDKTGAPAGYLLIACIAASILLLYNGIGVPLVQVVFGFLYPGYMTFKGLKYGREEVAARFAKYWAVLCVGVGVYVLLLWFIPEFPLLKFLTAIAVVFLVKSDALLAVSLYDSCLAVNVSKLEEFADAAISSIEYEEPVHDGPKSD
eukprot:TRINITY_DN7152_c0_g1_i11.p2 TRINITY_DN7152_c0_g1~~TRINITY_DN7152_c0_g1_i11.p2  ORF type:complete len:163 (+),score=51.03 TRINITY_DN7152_c0_g1_i11:74-562(+)